MQQKKLLYRRKSILKTRWHNYEFNFLKESQFYRKKVLFQSSTSYEFCLVLSQWLKLIPKIALKEVYKDLQLEIKHILLVTFDSIMLQIDYSSFTNSEHDTEMRYFFNRNLLLFLP